MRGVPSKLRRALLCLLIASLAILAHAPLAGAGFVGGDLALLREVALHHAQHGAAFPAWLDGGSVRPLAAAALLAHHGWTGGASALEPETALVLRGAALAVLLAAAAGAGITLRRLLVPWLGESAARAAGWACAGLIVAHPVSVSAVASPAAFGDVLAVAAGAWCAALFLRGRQERSGLLVAGALVLAIAAGFASRVAWILPAVLAGVELTSARRTRPGRVRIASACAVAALALLLVGLESAAAWSQAPPGGWPAQQVAGLQAPRRVLTGMEALGVLLLPAPGPGEPRIYILGCALLMLAIEPALRAVRSAPRLWGWLFLGWFACLVVALSVLSDQRVPPGRVELARPLLPAAILFCAGLAAASTALGGARRAAMPILIAAGTCWIASRSAHAWPTATRDLLALRGDLVRASHLAGDTGTVLVVDLPVDADGFGAPLDLQLLDGRRPTARPRYRRIEGHALPYALRLEEAAAWRAAGLAVLLPGAAGERRAQRVAPALGPAKPISWRNDGRSEFIDIDPLLMAAVRVAPLAGTSTGEPPRLSWLATSKDQETGSIEGAWVLTEDGPRAVFDLARSREWLLGGTVRRIWLKNQLLSIEYAEVLPELVLPGEWRLERWVEHGIRRGARIAVPLEQQPRALHGQLEWVLQELSVDPCEVRLATYAGRPLADGSIGFLGASAGSPIAESGSRRWILLECRIDASVAGRARPGTTAGG